MACIAIPKPELPAIKMLTPLAARNGMSFILPSGGLRTVSGNGVARCTASNWSLVFSPANRMASAPVWE
jgi:hypothetical protein